MGARKSAWILGDQVLLLVLQALHDRRIWRYYPLVLDDGWRIYIAVGQIIERLLDLLASIEIESRGKALRSYWRWKRRMLAVKPRAPM
jgi:hypothetical protein